MRKIILFIVAIFCLSRINSQVKLADILYDNFEYKTAASIYSDENDLTLSQLEKHAFCYFYTNDFQKSIPIFKKILDQNPNDFSIKYHYGIALKSTGRFKAAQKIFNELFTIDSTKKRLQFQIESIDSLIKWDTIKIFKKLVAFEKLNSASSEFSPSFYDDGIYYIVERGKNNAIANNINLISNNDSLTLKEKKEFTEKLNKILSYGSTISPRTYVKKVDLKIPLLLNRLNNSIPDSAIIKNEQIISHNSFNVTSFNTNSSNKKILYTRHPYLTNSNSDASLNPLIYQGKLNAEKKKLYLRRRIPVSFLSSSAGSGEVCMSSDGKTIYFVSDKKNGYGQTDIYVSHQKNLGNGAKQLILGR